MSVPSRAKWRAWWWDGRSEAVEHAAHHAGIADLLFPAINFTIFAYVIVRFLAAPIRELFRDRTERLRAELQAGARARIAWRGFRSLGVLHGLDELAHEARLVLGGERRLHEWNRLPDRFLHDLAPHGTARRLRFLIGHE